MGLAGEARGSSGKLPALVETKIVGGTTPGPDPPEIDTATNIEGIGGRNHPESFRSPSCPPSN